MTNPKNKNWFKRKDYGWGWQPESKEGWLVLLVYVILFVVIFIQLLETDKLFDVIVRVVAPLLILSSILIFVCYKKGERPKWQWGNTKK